MRGGKDLPRVTYSLNSGRQAFRKGSKSSSQGNCRLGQGSCDVLLYGRGLLFRNLSPWSPHLGPSLQYPFEVRISIPTSLQDKQAQEVGTGAA